MTTSKTHFYYPDGDRGIVEYQVSTENGLHCLTRKEKDIIVISDEEFEEISQFDKEESYAFSEKANDVWNKHRKH